jgi:hypothetical protein
LLLTWNDLGKTPEDERLLAIGFPGCQANKLPDFLMDVRRLAARLGYTQIFWIAPLGENVEPALQQAGFELKWEHNGFVYEKRHPLSGTGPTRP